MDQARDMGSRWNMTQALTQGNNVIIRGTGKCDDNQVREEGPMTALSQDIPFKQDRQYC